MHPSRRMMAGAVLVLAAAAAAPVGAWAAEASDANAGLLARYFADVNAHDAAALKDVIAESYVQHDSNQGQGLAGMQAAFRQYFVWFPDFHWTVEDSVIAGDKIVARFRITATHTQPVQLGPSAPLFPPTGKKLVWQGIS